MYALIALPLLIVLMGLGLPVAWSFAGVLAYLTWVYDANLNTLMLQGFRSLNSVVLVALPLFILTGYLMQSGGIAQRIIAFVNRLATGRGGMGTAMVLSSSIFGAISGTATAAIASIGSIMTEPLVARGYPRGRIAALLGISSLLGILIPPSITMILFAVVTRQSVAACFAATIGPAIILIIGLILYNRFLVGRAFEELPSAEVDSQSFGRVTLNALPALSLRYGDLVAALRRAYPDSPSRIRFDPDPEIVSLFGSYPELETETADQLGFLRDADADALVANAMV